MPFAPGLGRNRKTNVPMGCSVPEIPRGPVKRHTERIESKISDPLICGCSFFLPPPLLLLVAVVVVVAAGTAFKSSQSSTFFSVPSRLPFLPLLASLFSEQLQISLARTPRTGPAMWKTALFSSCRRRPGPGPEGSARHFTSFSSFFHHQPVVAEFSPPSPSSSSSLSTRRGTRKEKSIRRGAPPTFRENRESPPLPASGSAESETQTASCCCDQGEQLFTPLCRTVPRIPVDFSRFLHSAWVKFSFPKILKKNFTPLVALRSTQAALLHSTGWLFGFRFRSRSRC